jgi:energy-coupling factor transporter ATP-binding protein EcfA2
VVTALRRDDRVILIASHNLDELARLADRVAIIDHGRLQRLVDVRAGVEPDGDDRTPYRIALARGADVVVSVFPAARAIGPGEFQLDGLTLDQMNAGLAALLARGALVSMVYPVHSMLEQQFREAVGIGEVSS